MKEKVEEIIAQVITKDENLFLVELRVSNANEIQILIDSDKGLELSDISNLSRKVENELDREESDFSLMVSSPGLDYPLKLKRQFVKNIGRSLKIDLESGETIKAKLGAVEDDFIIVSWKQREKKPIGKGKITVEKTSNIEYQEIKKAVVNVSF